MRRLGCVIFVLLLPARTCSQHFPEFTPKRQEAFRALREAASKGG